VGAEYDRFARQYQKSKELPFRAHVEAHTLSRILGDPSGLAVLDLACGEGFYTRKIRRLGASKVVGADISGAMVALAREQEAREPLGIAYIHAGAEDLGTVGAFDVVTAAYLLNCARSGEHLKAMCRTIAANLRPGGRFVAINSNYGPGVPVDTSQYGFRPSSYAPIEEGAPYRLTLLDGPDAFELENHFYSRATYEQAFHQAGLKSVQWHAPAVSEEGVRAFGQDFWRDFLEGKPIIGIECS
jgi:toxoflavin synthase